MFRFENENFLYLLLLIPVFIAGYLFYAYKLKKKWQQYCESPLLSKLIPNQSKPMQHLKFSILMFALTAFIFALANPQVGSTLEKGKTKGIDIMICIDVSNSMMAKDISPNRLDASKMALNRFIDQLKGDRIGLIAFAGKAFVQLPITNDYAAAKMFVNYLNPNLIETQGTDIAAAIDLAAVSMLPEKNELDDAAQQANATSKVILVISDGEDHFQEAVDMAKKAHDLGITIHTIGIGSAKGAPIPISNGNFQKDQEGTTVITKLNETILQDVANAGGGVYVHANNANMGFDVIKKKTDKEDKAELQEFTFARYESKYAIPLIIGFILLFIEALLFSVKPRWKKWLLNFQNLFSMKKISMLLFILMLFPFVHAQSLDEIQAVRRGNAQYEKAEKLRTEATQLTQKGGEVNAHLANQKWKEAAQLYREAEVNYRKGIQNTKDYTKANYNLANTLYRQDKFQDAADNFKTIAENKNNPSDIRASSYHNLGNSLLKQHNYKESIEAYKNALKLNPNDKNTKYNLEYAKKKLIQQQNQQNKDQQNQQNKDQQNQQNKDQQNQQNKDQQNQQNKDQQNKDQQNQQNKDQQNQQNKDQQNQQNKDQQNQQNQGQNGQQQNGNDRQNQMDKRSLDALQQSENQTQKKVQKQQMTPSKKTKQDKDW